MIIGLELVLLTPYPWSSQEEGIGGRVSIFFGTWSFKGGKNFPTSRLRWLLFIWFWFRLSYAQPLLVTKWAGKPNISIKLQQREVPRKKKLGLPVRFVKWYYHAWQSQNKCIPKPWHIKNSLKIYRSILIL